MKGLVVKAISGFFYINYEGEIVECKARGNLKTGKKKIKVGDEVEFTELSDGKGVVDKLYKRKNDFIRPDISNVDCFVLVFSIKHPDINLELLDKFLVMAEQASVRVIIVLNKTDIASEKEIQNIYDIYGKIYDVLLISAKDGKNIDKLEKMIKGDAVALTGPSGAGKSTLTNLLLGEKRMETGEISEKTNRGKHTTRHSQIFSLNNGIKLFDTPGFTAFETASIEERQLKEYYPEFRDYSMNCKYDNCNHINEPICGVIDAVENGEIAKCRYDSYKRQFLQMEERNKKW